MRSSPARWFAPVLVVLGAAASASMLLALAPIARAACGTASSACITPSPSPIPQNAFLSLDVTSGDPNAVINVTGGQFLPGEQMSLYWDTVNKVAGGTTADANGNFNVRVKPFAGDAPGTHRLCASVPPNPCANFALTAPTPSPSPAESPSPSPSPSPTGSSSPSISPTPIAATLNSLDVISRPPFVFLPLVGLLAIAVSVGYWVLSVVRRPRRLPLPSAAVVHRATRPDYAAGSGLAPAGPSAPAAEPEPAPPALEPPATSTEAGAGPAGWGTGEPDTGYQFAPPPHDEEPGEPPTPAD